MKVSELRYEESLQRLLAFIRDETFGQGIRTYTGRDESQTRIHDACLELESRGLIRQHSHDGDCVLWMPVIPEPAKPKTD